MFMPEMMLKGTGVLTVIGELESAGMAQHVRMDWEGHFGGLAQPAHHAAKPDGTHGWPALAHEQIAPRLLLPLQSTECPKLGARERMH